MEDETELQSLERVVLSIEIALNDIYALLTDIRSKMVKGDNDDVL